VPLDNVDDVPAHTHGEAENDMFGIGVLTAAVAIGSAAAASREAPRTVPIADAVAAAVAQEAREPGLQSPDQPSPDADRRCDGCPPRSVGKALLHTTLINGVYELANLIRGQVTARITPKTWWDNMENGWVWDLDDFVVNQIGHPYQGNNYFNAARSNGLSFYESAAVTAFGSATWEYYGETNHPSLNDFINTTLGGIALGEMFHRAAWLIRNPRATGRGRLGREIGAMVLDPVTGLNRFVSGDASRVMEKPAEFVPTRLGGLLSAGVLWRGSNTGAFESSGDPFIETDLLYGDPTAGRSRTPYDAFGVRLTLGGGAGVSDARVRGRLLGEPFASDRAQFSIVQSYNFQGNDAYHFGAQSIEASVGFTPKVSARSSLAVLGWAGLTVLGAVDSLPIGVEAPPEEEEEDESSGQGISEGPRYYDYGPGSTFGASATFVRDGRVLGALLYEGRTLYSLDGVRANHLLQRVRLDLQAPLRGKLGIGATGEFFDRRSFYQDDAETRKSYHYPAFRLFLTWRLS
jgi:hypothetical protein